MNKNAVLSVQDVAFSYQTERGWLKAVSGVSFDLHKGETIALIGESGCGKSTLNLGLMRLLPNNARVDKGKIIYTYPDGKRVDLLRMRKRMFRRFRWSEMAMVPQGALNSMNPVIRTRDMFYDTATAHGIRNYAKIKARTLDLFEKVRLDPERVFNAYPHELSGGMRQRVLIALGLLLNPQIIILDEPTTALDILTQRSILDVLADIKREFNFSTIFISHDLATAAEIADTVATMYAGEIVEMGPVRNIFYQPRHAYTLGLMQASPRLDAEPESLASIPGSPPDLIEPPTGCKFHLRCPIAIDKCKHHIPPLEIVAKDHEAACFRSDEVLKQSEAVV